MVRLEFSTVGLVPEETYVAQAEENIAAGIPDIKPVPPHDTPLAIVGGGPSTKRHIKELVEWPGHIWGINQTAQWLTTFQPKAPVWLFSVDPDPCLADWTSGVDRALLGSSCHPKVFQALKGKDVHLFHTREVRGVRTLEVNDGSGVVATPKVQLFGPSSVCRSFIPAATLGYKDVTYFGCEGSIETETHAYRDESETRKRQMIIKAGGVDYITTPDYYITTKFLVNVMRHYKKLKEKSGGLLRAMLEHPDTWEVVAVSEALRDQVDPTASQKYIPGIGLVA